MKKITLDNLRDANITRCVEWMGAMPSIEDATFHACELGGEVGEALNIIKKFDRTQRGIPGMMDYDTARKELGKELADVLICVDLLAALFGIDLAVETQNKFNATSEKHGFKTKLGAQMDYSEIPFND